MDEALLLYAAELRRLLSRTERVTLLVIHQLALHHIVVGAASSEGPIPAASFSNAAPYLFSERAMERALTHMENSTQPPQRDLSLYSASG